MLSPEGDSQLQHIVDSNTDEPSAKRMQTQHIREGNNDSTHSGFDALFTLAHAATTFGVHTQHDAAPEHSAAPEQDVAPEQNVAPEQGVAPEQNVGKQKRTKTAQSGNEASQKRLEKIGDLRSEIADLRNKCKIADRKLADATSDNTLLRNQLLERTQSHHSLQKTNDELVRSNDALKNELKETRQSNDLMEKPFKAMLAQKDHDFQCLKNDHAKLQVMFHNSGNAYQTAKTAYDQQQLMIQKIQHDAQTECARLQLMIQNMRQTADVELGIKDAEIANLNSQINDLKALLNKDSAVSSAQQQHLDDLGVFENLLFNYQLPSSPLQPQLE
jgi:ribosomal protein S11